MQIIKKGNIFVLETENLQYVAGAGKNGFYHLHWGGKCPCDDFAANELSEQNSNHSVMDLTKTEYVPFGGTMYRECALKCTLQTDAETLCLKRTAVNRPQTH